MAFNRMMVTISPMRKMMPMVLPRNLSMRISGKTFGEDRDLAPAGL
jgi:hypothetical protein